MYCTDTQAEATCTTHTCMYACTCTHRYKTYKHSHTSICTVAATQEGTCLQDTHLPKEGPVHKDFLQKAHARGRVDLIQKHLHEAWHVSEARSSLAGAASSFLCIQCIMHAVMIYTQTSTHCSSFLQYAGYTYVRMYVCRYLQTSLPLVDVFAPAHQRQCVCVVCACCVCVIRMWCLQAWCMYTYRHFGHGAAFHCPLALQVCSLLENRL